MAFFTWLYADSNLTVSGSLELDSAVDSLELGTRIVTRTVMCCFCSMPSDATARSMSLVPEASSAVTFKVIVLTVGTVKVGNLIEQALHRRTTWAGRIERL